LNADKNMHLTGWKVELLNVVMVDR
jgi:hypothetical protein